MDSGDSNGNGSGPAQYTWLYTLRLRRPELLRDGFSEAELETLGRHVEHLTELTREGTVLLAGRTETVGADTFGLVVFVAEDEASARETMQSDPAVSEELMDAELHPFRLAFLAENPAAIL